MTKKINDGEMVLAERVERSPQELMVIALEKGADPAVLSRLMDLQERYDQQQARKAYVEAMSAFKKEAPAVLARDASVDFTSSKGRTHYNHATLGGIVATITPSLSKNGLSISWETDQSASAVKVTCHITHYLGHRESVSLNGPPDDSGNKNRIQQIGSSVTYLQRYTMLAALGLATADQDDVDRREPIKMPTPKEEPPKATPVQVTRKNRSDLDEDVRRANMGIPVGDANENELPFTDDPPESMGGDDAQSWQDVEIHFGKNKGEKLGEMSRKTLRGWACMWQPKPFQGVLSEADVELRCALDACAVENGWTVGGDE